MMDVKWMNSYEKSLVRLFEGGEYKNVGFVSYVAARAVSDTSVELSWYADSFRRFHEIRVVLPRSEFVSCVGSWQFDEKPHIFVTSEWLEKLHLRTYAVFAMVDAIGVKTVLMSGGFQPSVLIELRDRIDDIARAYPSFAFVSFADSLIIKSNWYVGMHDSTVNYTYEPEPLFDLLLKIRTAFKEVLGLGVYAVLAQGSNEYEDESPLHISATSNHISINSLGLPFAQLLAIDEAARTAIRAEQHQRADLYMDENFFISLNLNDHVARSEWQRFPYHAPMTTGLSRYYLGGFEEMLTSIVKAIPSSA